ncbi:protein kinase domain-containing protein [Herbidospora cretacea]|uniref:protein kinase domain-containing protein n=1 Tax=Herbidospora cretacea TaxID=28444 RepID=UPI000772F10E|nr:protein kinase [Herbidospora cretacea]
MSDGEPVTQGGPDLPPPAANGLFAGPADAPDRYELLGPGMHGGEGITWKARYRGELASPLPLAVKMLHPPPDAAPGWPSERDRQRWRDQAVLLRHLDLAHVVRLDEIFAGAPPHLRGAAPSDAGTVVYLVMEWVPGPTLHTLLAGRRATPGTLQERLGYVAQAAEALASLASTTRSGGNPSLHRDVKPGNCVVHAERGLVLIDITTLRLVDDGHDDLGRHTPAYTSPEVLAAPHLPRSPSADVYSLGALAYFCLTGQDPPPADAPGAAERIAGELRAVAEDAGAPDPGRLTSHLLATLDGQPSRRPTDLRNWARELTATPERPTRRLLRPALVTVATAALLSVLYGSQSTTRTVPPDVPPTTGNALRATGTITTPVDGADVKMCAYFSGTASLPPGTTLILAMKNLENGDPNRYVQVVFNWTKPATLSRWRGAQYFGGVRDGIGQDYRVDLLAVNLEDARRDRESDTANSEALVNSGVLLASVRVHRIPGTVPNDCEGP